MREDEAQLRAEAMNRHPAGKGLHTQKRTNPIGAVRSAVWLLFLARYRVAPRRHEHPHTPDATRSQWDSHVQTGECGE